ncbi:efflux RND transporter periplasmic adaptor subunit [Vibrio sp. JC009]|uniref:efflux RND transporter periplasmic adaptor subunit n=1 Tax=Vibrio sp. JC009 TaxID=2912314 RepID=UPI0023B12770|nr:efflux RND transporter periplasmic adaptor subunit [Vibrio sp. JC009]WED20881.1 efflux RND transporter periplasmic adaptor subunit [Vibrio sp. JC009]
MKKLSFIAVCISALLIATEAPEVVAAGQGKAEKMSKARTTLVVTETVGIHNISQSLTLIGKLEAEESVVISPEVSGKIDVIKVKANQKVKDGDLLVRLNDDKTKATFAEAQAYLKDEQRKLKEFEKLAKRGAITQTEIDAQKASVEIARARLAAEKANLSYLNITAPFDGTTGFIDFSRGKMVSAGTELLTLDNLSVMQLDLQVPERYLSLISMGMNVKASSNAWTGQVFNGSVTGIDTRINSETLNLRVRLQFSNQDEKLKPGMLMSANLEFPPVAAPIIPVQALQYAGTKRYVYIIDENSKAHKTEVILGARVGNEVVIEKGLKIGERIVVQGIVNMRDGAKVVENGQQQKRPGKKDKS